MHHCDLTVLFKELAHTCDFWASSLLILRFWFVGRDKPFQMKNVEKWTKSSGSPKPPLAPTEVLAGSQPSQSGCQSPILHVPKCKTLQPEDIRLRRLKAACLSSQSKLLPPEDICLAARTCRVYAAPHSTRFYHFRKAKKETSASPTTGCVKAGGPWMMVAHGRSCKDPNLNKLSSGLMAGLMGLDPSMCAGTVWSFHSFDVSQWREAHRNFRTTSSNSDLFSPLRRTNTCPGTGCLHSVRSSQSTCFSTSGLEKQILHFRMDCLSESGFAIVVSISRNTDAITFLPSSYNPFDTMLPEIQKSLRGKPRKFHCVRHGHFPQMAAWKERRFLKKFLYGKLLCGMTLSTVDLPPPGNMNRSSPLVSPPRRPTDHPAPVSAASEERSALMKWPQFLRAARWVITTVFEGRQGKTNKHHFSKNNQPEGENNLSNSWLVESSFVNKDICRCDEIISIFLRFEELTYLALMQLVVAALLLCLWKNGEPGWTAWLGTTRYIPLWTSYEVSKSLPPGFWPVQA